ncbi:hypothetical protein [Gordonia araii]|nr:hypothetical protein [Gordonia araii]NNG98806.1 hypothetical protein [Gordonia araii NBRC 100433]
MVPHRDRVDEHDVRPDLGDAQLAGFDQIEGCRRACQAEFGEAGVDDDP